MPCTEHIAYYSGLIPVFYTDFTPWSLAVRPLDYPIFRRSLLTLFDDNRQSDNDLRERALSTLAVLDDPQHALPHHLFRIFPQARPQCNLAKRVFLAMYDAAEEFGFERAQRYISAAICACKEDTDSQVTGKTKGESNGRLAWELSALACRVWLSDINRLRELFTIHLFLPPFPTLMAYILSQTGSGDAGAEISGVAILCE